MKTEITYTEAVVSEESGYTMQALYLMRVGESKGKYRYPPKLERKTHWKKMGATVVYTEAGRQVVMERAAKRKEKGGAA